MKDFFTCTISSDLEEKFRIALQLNQENIDEVIEKMIMQYISTSFSKASQAYKPVPKYVLNTINGDIGKANNRIPKWAFKPQQYNHRIIRSYFKVANQKGEVTVDGLEKMCSDENKHPDTYVRDFRGNFAQMKIDAPKSHGKVFEVDNGIVTIWSTIRETLMEYKKYFEEG